jgi:hypothetical protein
MAEVRRRILEGDFKPEFQALDLNRDTPVDNATFPFWPRFSAGPLQPMAAKEAELAPRPGRPAQPLETMLRRRG